MRISKRQLRRIIREAVTEETVVNDVIAALSAGDTKLAADALHTTFGEDADYFFDEMRPTLAKAPGFDQFKDLYNAVEDELYNLRKSSSSPAPPPSSKGRGKGIMDIVKKHGGKSVPRRGAPGPPEYEFPDERTAAQVVWVINDETGREAANSGKIVTVYS